MPAPSDRPNRLFIVSEVPALLAGMAFPTADTDWVELHRRGFQELVRLHPGRYDPAPLTAHEILLEDLAGGRKPLDAVSERDRVLERRASPLDVCSAAKASLFIASAEPAEQEPCSDVRSGTSAATQTRRSR